MVLEELKLFPLVKKWSEINIDYNHITENDDNKLMNNELWIGNILNNIIDIALNKSENLSNELNKVAKDLYDEWCNLKEAFKIPKKQRIEERKEHERELNLNESLSEKSNDDGVNSKKLTRIPSSSNFGYQNTNSYNKESYNHFKGIFLNWLIFFLCFLINISLNNR
jgi:hypothetical protein